MAGNVRGVIPTEHDVVTLAGGVGAAKFLRGLIEVHDPHRCTAIVNVADDFVLHGLHISPDIDTVTYTLSDSVNRDSGWGREDETWTTMAELDRYGGQTWFRLGDRDLDLHLYRTQRIREGACLSTVTAEVSEAWRIGVVITPVSDDTVATRLTLDDGSEIDFQDYFVARRHNVAVKGVSFVGADAARAAPGVLEAIAEAGSIVIAPSNPIVSIAPILAIPGVEQAVVGRRTNVVAISPIIGGKALKGPADRLLRELGHEVSVVGVARMYCHLASTLVVDSTDAHLVAAVEDEGIRCVVTNTIMSDVDRAGDLARFVLALGNTT